MKPICVIKSHPKGISLIMDNECSFEELVTEVCRLFAKSREFFKSGEMVLALEGRTLSSQQTLIIIEAIELNCNIKIPYILDDSEIRDARTVGLIDRFYFDLSNENAKIIKGNVHVNETVTSDTGLVIIGDLKKGASAIAKGNVIVIGKLEGEAVAGADGEESAFIVAGILEAKKVWIGGKSGQAEVKYRRFSGKKKKSEPVVIRYINGTFYAEPISDGLIAHSK